MARFATPLALLSLFATLAGAAHAEAPAAAKPADAHGAAKPADPSRHAPAKRAPTAMHTTPIAPPARPAATPAHAPAAAAPHAAPAAAKKPDAPAAGSAKARAKAEKPKPPCLHEPVSIARGVEEDRFSLTRCDGSPAPDAVAHLSILARPGSVARPTAALSVLETASATGPDLSPGIRKLDPKMIVRLQQLSDHFQPVAKLSVPRKLHVISGYRPLSAGSFHASGRALDFRIDGVSNEELVAFCKTLPDTGCGYYPNSSFVHLDVRDAGVGHIAWIDASGPGESPRYVSAWPPPPEPTLPNEAAARLDLPSLPIDEHPADVTGLGVVAGAPDAPLAATPDADQLPVPADVK